MILSIQKGSNAALIATIAPLWIGDDALVLDSTAGRLGWWKKYRPAHLTANDIMYRASRELQVEIALDYSAWDFRELPDFWEQRFDVVTFDPPYIAPGGRTTSTVNDFNDRYGLVDVPRTPDDTMKMIVRGMEEARRVLKPGGRLIQKSCNYVSSGKLVLAHHNVVDAAIEMGFEVADEFIHLGGTGPQPKFNRDGSPRRQVHARRAHSFLNVFVKKPLKSGRPGTDHSQ